MARAAFRRQQPEEDSDKESEKSNETDAFADGIELIPYKSAVPPRELFC